MTVLTTDGLCLSDSGWNGKLYKNYSEKQYEVRKLEFIPYYAWANRSVGEMLVWVREKE